MGIPRFAYIPCNPIAFAWEWCPQPPIVDDEGKPQCVTKQTGCAPTIVPGKGYKCAPCNEHALKLLLLQKVGNTVATPLVGGTGGGGGNQDQGGGGNQDQGGGGTQDQGGGGTQDQGTGDSDTGTQGQGGDAQDCGQPGEAPPPGKDCCEGGGVGPTGLCRQTLTGNRGQLGEIGGILGTGQQGRVGAGTPPPVLPGGQGPYLPRPGGGGGGGGGGMPLPPGAGGGGGGGTGAIGERPPQRTTSLPPMPFGGMARRPMFAAQSHVPQPPRRPMFAVRPDGSFTLVEVV